MVLGPHALIAGYMGLAAAPIALAWWSVPTSGPFWPEVATGLALAGYAMLLVQFILTGRFRVIGGRIGIDLVMRFHQLAARLLTVFIVLHPLLYGAPEIVTDPAGYFAGLWRLFASPALLTGVVAWFGLLALVAASVWRVRLGIDYEVWRVSHGLGALAIALFGLHHALTIGSLSGGGSLLGLVWIVLAGIAALTILTVYVLRPLMLRRRPWTVAAVKNVGPGRWTLTLVPERTGLAFSAGQFAWIKLGPSPFTVVEHPFSIASAPAESAGQGAGDGAVEFLIREAGDFTNRMADIEPGIRAWLDGPHGAFVLAPPETQGAPARIVPLAGGVGLAPILSILRQAAAEGDPRGFHLIFGNRTEEQIVLRDELENLKGKIDLRIDYVLSEPPAGWTGIAGQMDAGTLAPLLRDGGDPADALYYLCGPPAMVTAAEHALAGIGVPAAAIVAERFEYD